MPPARLTGLLHGAGSILAALLFLLCVLLSSASAATPQATTTTTTTSLAATAGATPPPLDAAALAAAAVPSDDDGDYGNDDAPLVPAAAAAASSSSSTPIAATAPSAASAAATATAAATAAASVPNLPFVSYSDPAPDNIPFNLGQFLDIQRQNFITRVVDSLLNMTGNGAAQPVNAPPGPLVDQPELRRPGQRWGGAGGRFPLPPPPPLTAEQRAAADAAGERYRAAAAGAGKRLGAAADDAQAAATRTAASLGLPAENAPPALPGSSGAVNPFRNLTAPTRRRYNSSRARRANFRRGATNGSSSGPSLSQARSLDSRSEPYYNEGSAAPLIAPLEDAAAAASDVIDDAAPVGIATVPAVSFFCVFSASHLEAEIKSFPSLFHHHHHHHHPSSSYGAVRSLHSKKKKKQGPGLPFLAFGGSGALLIFYAGVAEGLIEKGLLVPGVSKMSGFSGGAMAATVFAAGVTPRRMLEAYREETLFCNGTLPDRWWQKPVWEAKAALRNYADECMKTAKWPLDVVGVRRKFFSIFLGFLLVGERRGFFEGGKRSEQESFKKKTQIFNNNKKKKKKLQKQQQKKKKKQDLNAKLVPPEALANVSATVQVWASEVSPLFYYAQRSWPMGPYKSVQDLADKVSASSTLPCAITPLTSREVGGRAYIDGGFTTSTNQLCINATEASPCVTISATHFGPHGWVPLTRPDYGGTCDESVLIPPVWGLQARPLVGYGPQWPLDATRDRVTMRPRRCAVPEVLDLLVLQERHTVPPVGFPGWAINPGKRTPMPIPVCEFKGLLLSKANQSTAEAIFQHGVAEAKAFAAEVYGK